MPSVSICVKVKSKKWTTNDCEEEEGEEEEAQAGKDGKISMGSFPAKKMLWCFVSRIIHKNLDAMQAMMPSVYPLARKKKNHLNLMCINLLRKSSSSNYNLGKHMCIYIFCPRQEECTDYYFLKSEDRRRMKSLCAVIDRPFFSILLRLYLFVLFEKYVLKFLKPLMQKRKIHHVGMSVVLIQIPLQHFCADFIEPSKLQLSLFPVSDFLRNKLS